METIVFNSIQVINYWFTLHCTLRLLYQQAQTFSSNIQGISDQNVTVFSDCDDTFADALISVQKYEQFVTL